MKTTAKSAAKPSSKKESMQTEHTKKGPVRGSTMNALRHLAPAGRQTTFLRHEDIEPDPDQPRMEFRPVDGRVSDVAMQNLRDFAHNIRDIGLKQPITVRENPGKPGKYIIVMGERRWRAVGILREEGTIGFEEIEAFIQDDQTLVPVLRLEQLAENIQREDLTDLEVATFLRRLLEDYKELQQQDLCVLLHKPKQWVSRMLGLLDPRYAELVNAGHIRYAAILEQYKALPSHRQEALAKEAQATGKKITSGDIKRHAEAAKQAGEKPAKGGNASMELRNAVENHFAQSPAGGEALAIAVARQEVRIKAVQAETLLSVLHGRDFAVTMTLSATDMRDAIGKLGGDVPENDLLLAPALYDCLTLK